MNLALLLGIILCLCCLIFNKSKIMFYTSLFYIWIIFAGAYGHADYFTSENVYNNSLNRSIGVEDPLWAVLRRFFYRLDFSYQEFLAVTSAILLIMLAIVIRRLTKNIGVVLGLYMISPFALDVVQYNNFAGMVFVLFAVQYLLKERRSIVKFLIFTTLATGICSYCVVYYALLLTVLDIKKVYKIAIIGTLSVAFLPNAVFYIAQRFVVVEKIQAYFSVVNKSGTVIGLELFVLIYIIWMVLLVYFAERKKFVKNFGTVTFETLMLILKINIIMAITLALQIYSLEAARFYRNIFVLNYIAVSHLRYVNIGVQHAGYIKNQTAAFVPAGKKALTKTFELAVLVLAFAYSYLYMYHWNKTSVLIPVFEYNLFFGGL